MKYHKAMPITYWVNFVDIDNCEGNPCLNGGTSTDGVGSYTCSCAAVFTGMDCERSMSLLAIIDPTNSAECNEKLKNQT